MKSHLFLFILISTNLTSQNNFKILQLLANEECEFIFRLDEVGSEYAENCIKKTTFRNYDTSKKEKKNPMPLSCSILKFYKKNDDTSKIFVVYYSHNKDINSNYSFVPISHCALDVGETIKDEPDAFENCTTPRLKYGYVEFIDDKYIIIHFKNETCKNKKKAKKRYIYNFKMKLSIIPTNNQIFDLSLTNLEIESLYEKYNISMKDSIGFAPLFNISNINYLTLKH